MPGGKLHLLATEGSVMELSRRTGYGPAMWLQCGTCERELPGDAWPEPVETLTLQSKDGIGENGKNISPGEGKIVHLGPPSFN